MLAANVAVALGACKKKTLLIDWDLEAPGIGDFLDVIGSMSKKGRISELWQKTPGIFDLVAQCAETDKPQLGPRIDEFLSTNVINVRGDLDLLGPAQMWGRDYPAALMTLDWFGFFRIYAFEFAAEFRSACSRYDTVIIDTRTGLNLSTVYVLRFLADKVFFVSPKTHQALEGSRRMAAILQVQEGPTDRTPEQFLVLSRHQGEAPGEDEAANHYLKRAFGKGLDELPYQFPHLKVISSVEQLAFENEALRPYIVDPKLDPKDSAIKQYRDSFRELCMTVADVDVFRHSDLARETEKIQKAFNDSQSAPSGYEGMELKMREYIRKLEENEAFIGTLEQPVSKPSAAGKEPSEAVKEFILWHSKARSFDRSALNIFIKLELARYPDPPKLEASFEELLLQDNSDAVTAELPGTKGPREHAEALSRDALRLQDADDPVGAVKSFQAAIDVLTNSELDPLDPAELNEWKNSLAIDTWWLITLLYRLVRWEDAAKTARESIDSQDLFAAGSVQWPTRADFQNLLLFLEWERMNSHAARLFDSETLERAAAALSEARDARTPEQRSEDRCQMAELQLWSSQLKSGVQPSGIDRVALKNLIEAYDGYLALFTQSADCGRVRTKTRLLAESARAYALLARDTGEMPDEFRRRLSQGREELESWLSPVRSARYGDLPASSRPGSPSADDIMTLAMVHFDCGNPLAGSELCDDALQVMNPNLDRAVATRADAVAYIGILEDRLGRPDLARHTWESLAESWSVEPPAAGSRREELAALLPWWKWVAEYELASFSEAWDELVRESEELRSRPDVQRARRQLMQIQYFLAQIAVGKGDFQVVADRVRIWEDQLNGIDSLDVDLHRRLAVCRFLMAQACYCLGNDREALAHILEGRNYIASSAQAFGIPYALVHLELRLLEAEILTFRNLGQASELAGLVREFELLGDEVLYRPSNTLPDPKEQLRNWFYTDLVRIATGMATAAAINLRLGHTDEAHRLAHSARERWLSFITDSNEAIWKKITAVPLGLAEAVISALPDLNGEMKEVQTSASPLQPGQELRYRSILDFCKERRESEPVS